jgi:hypothetical protein
MRACKSPEFHAEVPVRRALFHSSLWTVLFVFLVALPSVIACWDKGGSESLTHPGDDEDAILVLFQNQTAELVHLFGEGETFPCCQLGPNGSRELHRNAKEAGGDTFTFRAGRNGQIIASGQCTTTRAMMNGDEIGRVVWDGAAIQCIGWDN